MDLFDSLARRNPDLVATAAQLHQERELPSDCYVADVDAIAANAIELAAAVARTGLETFFEAKQFGRCPPLCRLLREHGFSRALAIDIEELYALERLGIPLGHVGHLGQIPSADVEHVVAETRPEFITVYSYEKAREIAAVARREGLTQKLVVRVNGDDDHVPLSITGGIAESDALPLIADIARLDGAEFAGFTTYPAIRFDLARHEWVKTPNLDTMVRLAERIDKELGIEVDHINAAGNICVESVELASGAGATHCEPGQAFVGGLVANGFVDQAEVPAIVYVTEVSHVAAGSAWVYAPSMVANNTIGIWNPLRYDELLASISRPGSDPLAARVRARPQQFAASDPTAFMFNAIHPLGAGEARVGDSVVFGFRTQLYRANGAKLAAVEGIRQGQPKIVGFFDRTGNAFLNRTGELAVPARA